MIAWAAILFFGLSMTALAFTMTIVNLRLYRAKSGLFTASQCFHPASARPGLICVCVPARNEESNIEACVRSLLTDRIEHLEVLVYDDQSTDSTSRILQCLAESDPRVVCVPTLPLPRGWNGKQHACWRMARAALDRPEHRRARWLLFTDADVRFEPGSLTSAVATAESRGVGLLSTFPRQITATWAEHAVVPMIFFILFSYLPMPRMRRTLDPAASAGCGQFLLCRADAYEACAGHEGFKDSMHDGIRLPRAVRRAGFRTDLFDGTCLCSVRMYRGLAQTWSGFTKNAYEGLGSLTLLIILTLVHLCGHVLPWVYLIASWGLGSLPTARVGIASACIALALIQRLMLTRAFNHHWSSALLHPIGVVMVTMIQWHSYLNHLTGKRSWRGRTHGDRHASEGTDETYNQGYLAQRQATLLAGNDEREN